MKKTILFLLVCICMATVSFIESAETLKFKKLEKFKLNGTQLKAMKKSNLNIYEITNGYAYPGKGYDFYTAKTEKGVELIYVLNSNSKTPEVFEIAVNTIPFTIIHESPTLMVYCSCGLNVVNSDGDDCIHYQTSGGIQCGGACRGDNEGSNCSVTSLNTETGVINPSVY